MIQSKFGKPIRLIGMVARCAKSNHPLLCVAMDIEVTFEETRAHLGIETQRQWSDKAIARTTPLLMGLFSFVTLGALQNASDKSIAQHGNRLMV